METLFNIVKFAYSGSIKIIVGLIIFAVLLVIVAAIGLKGLFILAFLLGLGLLVGD